MSYSMEFVEKAVFRGCALAKLRRVADAEGMPNAAESSRQEIKNWACRLDAAGLERVRNAVEK
jgi:hypothetical protein